jgi:cbb3-type cytochrome oxidase subunit 3
MIREAFTNPNPWAALATLAFVGLFVAIVVYVATDRRRRHHEKMQALPLEDDRHA